MPSSHLKNFSSAYSRHVASVSAANASMYIRFLFGIMHNIVQRYGFFLIYANKNAHYLLFLPSARVFLLRCRWYRCCTQGTLRKRRYQYNVNYQLPPVLPFPLYIEAARRENLSPALQKIVFFLKMPSLHCKSCAIE